MANGQTDLDKAVGPQPEDMDRKLNPRWYEGHQTDGIDDAHHGGGSDQAAETIKPFKLGG